jgi:hypothetical protein
VMAVLSILKNVYSVPSPFVHCRRYWQQAEQLVI